MDAAAPLEGADFAACMAPLGAFEPEPHVAVAVSGGADSLALAVLLQEWTTARGGRLTALTVDHRLRPGSAAEARRVGDMLQPLGVAHRRLVWRGARPRGGLQAAAREARYRLLVGWCARAGVLHLALGHHLEDQAETLLLRLGRGSGLDGLAAMPAVVEMPELRLLRPLLAVPKDRLQATLRTRGLHWIEDPSNRDLRHARVRLRALLPQLAAEGLSPARLAEAAAHLGRARGALEQARAQLLARAASLHPAGFAWLEPAPLAAAPEEVSRRALARLLMAVGGAAYPPRLERLARLHDCLREGLAGGRTLAGCRVLPRRGRWLVVREPGRAERRAVHPGERLLWDGRFAVALAGGRRVGAAAWTLAPLGAEGWRRVAAAAPALRASPIPPPARPGLPALADERGIVEVPALGYRRDGDFAVLARCAFAPRRPLTGAGFTVA